MAPITPEFLLVAIACGVGCAVGSFMAARRNRVAFEFNEAELEGTDMDGTQLTFADAEQAIEARNKILDDVADSNAGWLKRAMAMMARIPDGRELTGEDLRLSLLEVGLSEPRHPGAWGALTGTLARKGFLVHTGEWRAMRQKTSHGRLTRLYRKHTPDQQAA
jgi:hypothetical protein